MNREKKKNAYLMVKWQENIVEGKWEYHLLVSNIEPYLLRVNVTICYM